jgi:molybdenum cofactor biosynthesis enzyme MoaA
MYDFANLLFAGPCNARCYFCIGHEIDPALRPNNLKIFPPDNLEAFIALILQYQIRQVVFTGTDTDPQLYEHEAHLLAHLRERLPPETRFSLHTNGRLALQKIKTFNQYDRAAISVSSFDPVTYQQMMGVPGPPDLGEIMHQATIPIKISCLASAENAVELPSFLQCCQDLGVQRVILRKRFGEPRPWDVLIPFQKLNLIPKSSYRSNQVYDFLGMEVTLWEFDQSTSTSINLFASGLISSSYLLTKTQPIPNVPLSRG